MCAEVDPAILDAVRRSIPEPVIEIAKVLDRAGYRTWVVGGSLRDQLRAALIGTQVEQKSDWDLATDAHPRNVQRLFRKVIPTGIKHGTVTVLINQQAYEVTTLRGEVGYSDGRRPDNVYFVDEIREDLARRDFTVNAIALDPLEGHLVDPFGGIGDLQHRLIRAVGNPLERFQEDGLRVLRAARFVASLEFELDAGTAGAIRPSLDSFRKVSPERVRDEWVKSMKSRLPSRAFSTMHEHGLLEIIAPDLAALGAGSGAALEITQRAVDHCTGSLQARFAALLHKLGSSSPEIDFASIRAPSVQEARAAELARALLTSLKFSNKDHERISALVRHQGILDPKSLTDPELRRWLRRVSPSLVDDLQSLMTAIATAHANHELLEAVASLHVRARQVLAGSPPLRLSDLEVSGDDLKSYFQLAPGPAIGRLLEALLEMVVEAPEKNQREVLLAAAQAWLSDHQPA